MYFQFLSILALGLLGLCLVLTILLDYVFVDWDLFEGFRDWLRQVATHKRSYTVIQDIEEEGGAPRLVSRLIPERRHGQRVAALEAPVSIASWPRPKLPPMEKQGSDEQPEETVAASSGRHGYWLGPKP